MTERKMIFGGPMFVVLVLAATVVLFYRLFFTKKHKKTLTTEQSVPDISTLKKECEHYDVN